jgi:hypothetical protein
MPMDALAAPAVFILPPGGPDPIRVARTWATDIQIADDGSETRIATRDLPTRRQSFSAVFENARDAGVFRSMWYAALQPLRFQVPLWRERADPTAIAGDTVTCDTTDRRFVEGQEAILWQFVDDEIAWETFTIQTVTSSTVVATAPFSGAYQIGAVICLPAMNAWLDPPTINEQSYSEVVPLVFREELPVIAGIDPSVTGAFTPVIDSISLFNVWALNGQPGHDNTIIVDARDADNMPIIDVNATWSLSSSDPTLELHIAIGKQAARVRNNGALSPTLTVTVLGVSAHIGL